MSQRSSQKRSSSRRSSSSRKSSSSSSRRSSLFNQHVLKAKNDLKKLQKLKLKITWPRYIKDSRIKSLNREFTSRNIFELTKEYNRNTFIGNNHKTNVTVIGNMFVKYDTVEYALTKFGLQKKLTELLNHIWETKLKSKKIHSYLGVSHHRPRKLKTKKNSKGRNVTNHSSNSNRNENRFVYPNVQDNNNIKLKSLTINKLMKFQSKIPKLNITIELTKK